MAHADVQSISPFFIVSDVEQTVAFYRDHLGFHVTFQEPQQNPFFSIVVRGGAQLFFKSERGISPQPNSTRHPHLRWDAYVYVPDPDLLAEEFEERSTPFCAALADTHDGLRGFEVQDPDGYVLFFGRPFSNLYQTPSS